MPQHVVLGVSAPVHELHDLARPTPMDHLETLASGVGPVFMLGYALVAMFLISRKHRGGTSHEGHLGGALIGLAVTALLSPRGLDPLFRWFTQWV